jgi:hypothetical protein
MNNQHLFIVTMLSSVMTCLHTHDVNCIIGNSFTNLRPVKAQKHSQTKTILKNNFKDKSTECIQIKKEHMAKNAI